MILIISSVLVEVFHSFTFILFTNKNFVKVRFLKLGQKVTKIIFFLQNYLFYNYKAHQMHPHIIAKTAMVLQKQPPLSTHSTQTHLTLASLT